MNLQCSASRPAAVENSTFKDSAGEAGRRPTCRWSGDDGVPLDSVRSAAGADCGDDGVPATIPYWSCLVLMIGDGVLSAAPDAERASPQGGLSSSRRS